MIEERVLLIRARSFDEAIRRAESEARAHADGVPAYLNRRGERVETRYLGECDPVELGEELGHGVEVYWFMRVVGSRTSTERLAAMMLKPLVIDEKERRRRASFEPCDPVDEE
jgi:hypothetical protein